MPKKPTYFQERKDFISRFIKEDIKVPFAREQKFAKDLFNQYPVQFLIKVQPDFKLNSLAFLFSEDGKKFLDLKLKEFLFKPKRKEIIEGDEKVGYNWERKKTKTFRKFLEDE